MKTITSINNLFSFLIDDTSRFLPELNTKDPLLKRFYSISKKALNQKDRQNIKRSYILDKLLLEMIYLKELSKLKGKDKGQDSYSRTIGKFIEYPTLIAKNQKTDISGVSEGINRLILIVTHSCQLRCKYCSVRKFNANMDKNTLKKAIDLLFTSKKNNLQLQFFGGEPLLRFNLIKKGVAYARDKSKKTGKCIKFIITTNGIALDKEKADFLKENDFSIEFSIDGDIKTQLKNRKASSGKNYYKKVLGNLKYLSNIKADYYSISVVSPEDTDQLTDNINHLFRSGVDNIQLNYALGTFWERKKVIDLIGQIKSISKRKKNSRKKIMNLTDNRKEPVVLNSEVTVDCDGTIYLETGICLEKDFNKLKSDFKLGTLDTITDINKIFISPARNFKKLVDVYSKEKEEFRKIILNNIELGFKLKKSLCKQEPNTSAKERTIL